MTQQTWPCSPARGSSALQDMAGTWAGESCCPQEVGRAGRSSRTPRLISPMPKGAFLTSPWGYLYPLPTVCSKLHHSFASCSHFIPSLRELHLWVHFSPGDEGGYLQPESDVGEAQGVLPSWHFPCWELQTAAGVSSTECLGVASRGRRPATCMPCQTSKSRRLHL